jgi:hypothetical protein
VYGLEEDSRDRGGGRGGGKVLVAPRTTFGDMAVVCVKAFAVEEAPRIEVDQLLQG